MYSLSTVIGDWQTKNRPLVFLGKNIKNRKVFQQIAKALVIVCFPYRFLTGTKLSKICETSIS